jgi:flagellar biosynthesis component FlhA
MNNLVQTFIKYRELILPVSIIACIGVILVPLPPFLLDILLAGNVTVAVIILLTTINAAGRYNSQSLGAECGHHSIDPYAWSHRCSGCCR